jgi:hypothetical protein
MSIQTRISKKKAAEERACWQRAVSALKEQVEAWARAQGWPVAERSQSVTDDSIGTYEVPILEIDTPKGRVVLEPIGRDILGAHGRVDLYAWPTHYRVMLLRTGDDQWVVRTDSGLNWPAPWGDQTFVTLAEGLAEAL